MDIPIVAKNTFSFTTDTDRVLSLISEQTGFSIPHLEVVGLTKIHLKRFLENCVRVNYVAYELKRSFPDNSFQMYSNYSFPFDTESIDRDAPDFLRRTFHLVYIEYEASTSEESSLISYDFSKKDVSGEDKVRPDEAYNIRMESYLKIPAEEIKYSDSLKTVVEGAYINRENELISGVYKEMLKIYCQRIHKPYFYFRDLMLYINYPVIFEYIKNDQKICL